MKGIGTLQVDTRNGLFANEGYGGGVFNYNTAFGSTDGTPAGVRGLGEVDPRYPWREFSADTQALQIQLNQELAQLGSCPLLVDGKLGPRTCGALALAPMAFRNPDAFPFVSTCESAPEAMILPHEPPCLSDLIEQPAPTPAPPEEESEPELPQPSSEKTGNTGMLIALGLLGLAGVVAVMGSKKKGL